MKNQHKLIRIKEVTKITGLSKSYIYDLRNRNLFPDSIQLVLGGSSVAWIEEEVFEWVDNRIQERNEKNATLVENLTNK